MHDVPDNDLVERYLLGDKPALEALIERYLSRIYNFISKYTGDLHVAADLTQDTFVKVWKKIDSFDRSKSFKSWIFAVARNTSLDWLRKRKSVPMSTLDTDEEVFDVAEDEPSVYELFDVGLLHERLRDVIDSLAPPYQTVLLLRSDEHFTFQEIADLLKEPLDTVKSRYRRGLATIKKNLKKPNAPK
jgi:RNA polymerase sigma-70 factor (ECF subfamily)